jgi:TetR/AcrR family transcriptional regulator
MATGIVSQGPRGERTRIAILEAAETLFAERGFAATRLEDIAERVGIRRASIVYHFKDKRELHEAVQADLMEGLLNAIRDATSIPGLGALERIEAAVGAWVDYVGSRPPSARLILRAVANTDAGVSPSMLAHAQALQDLVRSEFVDSAEVRDAGFAEIDPIHVAATVAGSTVFFLAAMPLLVSRKGFDPAGREHLEAYKQELIRVVRHLLGVEPSP